VAPVLEVGHVGVGLAVAIGGEVVDFAIVELQGDNVGDLLGSRAGGDVLAVGLCADGAVRELVL